MATIGDQLTAKGGIPETVQNRLLALADPPSPQPSTNGGCHWGHASTRNVLGWRLKGFGEIDSTTLNFSMDSQIHAEGPNTWVKISPKKDRPREIQIRFTGELEEGVVLLHAAGKTLTDMMTVDKFPPFNAPIRWENQKGGTLVARTNQRYGDDVDMIFIDTKTGEVAVLEVSVAVRGDRQFWQGMQHAFHGQFVELTSQEATTLRLETVNVGGRLFTAVPLVSENAYPGADFQKNFSDMAEAVTRHAAEHGYFKPLAEVEMAAWEPQWLDDLPEHMQQDGWSKAVTLWFNLVMGWGFALCEDGKTCMVHFGQMLDEGGDLIAADGEMSALRPMTGIAIQREETSKGFRAQAIRAP